MVVEMCQYFHDSTIDLSDRFRQNVSRYNYVTPTSYLELVKAFKGKRDYKLIPQFFDKYVKSLSTHDVIFYQLHGGRISVITTADIIACFAKLLQKKQTWNAIFNHFKPL